MTKQTSERPWHLRAARARDVVSIHALICELAAYERAAQEVVVTPEDLRTHGYGDRPRFMAWVVVEGPAPVDGQPRESEEVFGCALAYEKYSTWKGPCLFLEDLIVRESQRGRGAGKALFEAVAAQAARAGFLRMEWQVLDWNAPSIAFYEGLGAELDPTWINGKLTGEALARYARMPIPR